MAGTSVDLYDPVRRRRRRFWIALLAVTWIVIVTYDSIFLWFWWRADWDLITIGQKLTPGAPAVGLMIIAGGVLGQWVGLGCLTWAGRRAIWPDKCKD